MTDAIVVLRKLAVLRTHLERARRRRGDDLDALLGDLDRQDALAMSFLVAVQEAVEVDFHISTDEGWGLPGSNAEAFALLAENGLLTIELSRRLAGCTAVRNRIAHGYATVDIERFFDELPAGLAALDAFVVAVAAFLA